MKVRAFVVLVLAFNSANARPPELAVPPGVDGKVPSPATQNYYEPDKTPRLLPAALRLDLPPKYAPPTAEVLNSFEQAPPFRLAAFVVMAVARPANMALPAPRQTREPPFADAP